MLITWKERLLRCPWLWIFSNWPIIDVEAIPKEKRAGYLQNLRIVALALEGNRNTLESIAAAIGISRSTVSHVLRRALGGDEFKPPALTSALVPNRHLDPGERKKALSSRTNKSGAARSLKHIFSIYPDIEVRLYSAVKSDINKSPKAQNYNGKSFNHLFLALLREKNWDENVWPFDKARRGEETTRKLLERMRKEVLIERQTKSSTSILPISRPLKLRAYEKIQIDSQLQDIESTIEISLDEDLVPLRVARPATLLAVDAGCDLRLAYEPCLTQQPSQTDVLRLLKQLHQPWTPKILRHPALSYSEGAMFPTGLGPEYTRIAIGMIELDNAMSNLAYTVQNYVCNGLHATLHAGRSRTPLGRSRVEHAFDASNDTIHRFASTTGSHNRDPKKEDKDNRKLPPCLSYDTFIETWEVMCTHHNILPQAQLGAHSPLETLRHQMENTYIRLLPPGVSRPDPMIQFDTRTVNWRKNEKRNPYIEFLYSRYSAPELCDSKFINKPIKLLYDIEDIRTVKAYSIDGELIGDLHAPISWQRFRHGLTTRQRIYKKYRDDRSLGRDILVKYFIDLLDARSSPIIALELLRVSREYGSDSINIIFDRPVPRTTVTARHPAAELLHTVPTWTADLVRKSQQLSRQP